MISSFPVFCTSRKYLRACGLNLDFETLFCMRGAASIPLFQTRLPWSLRLRPPSPRTFLKNGGAFAPITIVRGGEGQMRDEIELRDLGRALKARRAEAWERLYALTSLPLLRALRRALGDPALAEEALQAAFVTAIEMVDRFDPA